MSSEDPMGEGASALEPENAWHREPSANQRLRLVKGGAIVLERDGFRVIGARGMARSTMRPYESITHVAVTDRALLIGTMSGLSILNASDFPDPQRGPQEARQALLARLAERPDADFVMERIERLEALHQRGSRPYAIWTVIVLCLVATLLQLRDPSVTELGSFVPELFRRGEFWRAMTAHFLHGDPRMPIHLAMNVGGLVVLGYLVERPLGTTRTTVVLGMGALGTIFGSIYYGYTEVIGASGLVAALAGAMLAMELHFPDSLPSHWRLPRRIFIWALVLQFLVIDPLFAGTLAGGAHLGGFAGGYAAVWFMQGPGRAGARPSRIIRILASTTVVAFGFSLAAFVPLARHEEGALEHHALHLLNAPPILGAQHDNAVAWFIATEGEPSTSGAQLAVALADRAADATERLNPNVLDTLAEAFFQAGDRLAALLTIDEAIRLAPRVSYFQEQRRRFIGERAADDRPESPDENGWGGSDPDESEFSPFDPDTPAMTI